MKSAANKGVDLAKQRVEAERHSRAEAREAAHAAAPASTGPTAAGAPPAQPAPPALSSPGFVMRMTSRDQGRNAQVTLYRDRIEREKPRSFNSWSRAHQDTEVIPLKSVSSVQVTKDGLRSKVILYATGNTIEFRVSHDDAQRFKRETLNLILSPAAPPPAAAPAPAMPAIDVADQLAKLAALRDQGILTDEEFAAQKAKLLG